MPESAAYSELCSLLYRAGTMQAVAYLLSWDQETYMPPGAANTRSEQLADVAELLHQRRTSPRLGELIAQCESDGSLTADPAIAANLREIRRDFDLATKLPADLVSEIARVTSQAQDAWKSARAKNDFKSFAPWLEKVVTLSRRKAECYGVPAGGVLYDALLDEYEPGMTSREVEATFMPLRSRLSDLIARVTASKKKVNTKCLSPALDAAAQHRFGLKVVETLGFDLKTGRLDTTAHPFCTDIGPGDVRLTTRYREQHFSDALYSTMHEAGHGIYEQGLPKEAPAARKGAAGRGLYGQPLSQAISLGIHESQSRMWENFVGRSRPFWTWALPLARKTFGPKLGRPTVDQLYAAVNTVTPSLIRVESDEATYNLHIMVRFELERALISGNLSPRDLPKEWNARYKDYLGIKVPDDARGCMQDVHWSAGLIGYFPTYTLGNLYAAQFWETINKKIPTLEKQIAKGQFGELKAWLNKNIHRHGRRYRAAELCENITGKPLSADPLLRHLTAKAEAVYGI